MSVTVKIWVKPHVKKFVEHQCGNLVVVSTKNYVTAMLLSMLRHYPKVSMVHKKEEPPAGYPAFLSVVIPTWYLRNFGQHITPENMVLFNDAMDEQIKHEMMIHVCGAKGCTYTDSIQLFRELYRFDKDLSFDNLKKYHQRHEHRYKRLIIS